MTPDDAHTSHNHGFELPNAPQVVVRHDSRRWRAVAGVALCLGLAGIVTGLIVARRQSLSDAHLTSDALQREELRDGWRALGAAAVQDAQANGIQPSAAATAPAQPTAPNVVIVNVPAQSANAAPPNVTNINVPNGATGAPTSDSNVVAGAAPIQSMPAINFSPMQGYAPGTSTDSVQNGYIPQGYTIQNGYAPQNGTTGGTSAPYTPPVGNGSIPGSTPNPALNNNGLVGSTPTPGLPNGNPTPSAPVGTVPIAPSSPSLPSGFSAP